uniref:Receptor ligand binding region domain-containing protein n=1 Tax=Sinocyclocheilus anshuiensis TaxID=1608454 RepID=A0A671LWB5_9TELE
TSLMIEAQKQGLMNGDSYAAYLHDAVLLYAMGLKEAFKNGKDIRHGREILQKLRDRTNIRFYGASGLVHFDEYGERNLDYSVYDLQQTEMVTKFVSVLDFDSHSKMMKSHLRYYWTLSGTNSESHVRK